jgi:hypothetical protein
VIDRLRRRGALSAAVLLLAAPALASCGFDYATDRVNTIAPGANDRSGDVKVLGAVVIAESDGSGVFVATMTNSSDGSVSLTNLTGESDDGTLAVAGTSQAAIEVPAGGRTSLIEEGGVPLEGDFAVGDFVAVTLSFDNGQTVTLDTNVVRPCFQYSPEKLGELDFPESSGETDSATSEAESGEGETGEEGEATGPDAYSCDTYESEVWPDGGEPHHGGAEH